MSCMDSTTAPQADAMLADCQTGDHIPLLGNSVEILIPLVVAEHLRRHLHLLHKVIEKGRGYFVVDTAV